MFVLWLVVSGLVVDTDSVVLIVFAQGVRHFLLHNLNHVCSHDCVSPTVGKKIDQVADEAPLPILELIGQVVSFGTTEFLVLTPYWTPKSSTTREKRIGRVSCWKRPGVCWHWR
jgi:hypothetical protein